MVVAPASITWLLTKPAANDFAVLRADLGDVEYARQRQSLQALLCAYFGEKHCDYKLGKSIAPVAPAPPGKKLLKVRWALPGRGKSGGLRIILSIDCKHRRCTLLRALERVDEPTSKDIDLAAKLDS